MEQLILGPDNNAFPHRPPPQAEYKKYSDVPAREKYDYANAMQKPVADDISASAINKPIVSDLYVSEGETLLGDMKPEAVSVNYQEELRRISMQLLKIQENERQRIAADLHDGIGQSLSLIKLSVESVMQQIRAGAGPEVLESLQQVSCKVKETMDELHHTAMDMRPSMLDDLGIIPTLSWFFREFESAWRGRKLEKEIGIVESDVPLSLRVTIFRLLQEAMNNIVKHSSADCIRVSLKKSGGLLQLSIEDNGSGFDLDSVNRRCGSKCCDAGCGFGLMTMKERARSTNGIFEMKSAVDRGTRIVVSWWLVDGTANQDTDHGPVLNE